jgi:Autographiviridae endonuclease VII
MAGTSPAMTTLSHRGEATGIAYLKALVMDQEDPKEKQRRYQREWITKRREDPVYREKERQEGKIWRDATRDERSAEWRHKYANDEEFRAKHNARGATSRRKRTLEKHGLSLEDYDAMLAQQHGACGICEIPFQRTPCIDHCHVTGLVRGLLCNNCNLAIGNLQDNPSFAYSAGNYLERWVQYLWQIYHKEGNDMSSIEDRSDRSKAAQLIRNAILNELQQPHGIELPPPADKLQAIVRGLVAKAEGAQDLNVVKEVFDRVSGGTSSTCRAHQWPGPISLPWKQPEPGASPSAPAPKAKRGRPASPRSESTGIASLPLQAEIAPGAK